MSATIVAAACRGLLASAAMLSATVASAKTPAVCAEEYAARKAAGETGGQSRADYVKACLAAENFAPASDAPKVVVGSDDLGSGDTKGQSATDLAKKLQNPIGDLYSFPFQNNTNFGFGPKGGTQDVLNIQPVIPIHLTPDWNVITRTILPLVWTPDLSPVPSVPFGTAPTSFSAFLSPKNPTNGWLWA